MVVVGCVLIGVCEPAGDPAVVSPTGPAEPDCVVGEVEVGERRERLERVVARLVLGVPVDIVDPAVPSGVDIGSAPFPVCGAPVCGPIVPVVESPCAVMPPAPGPDDPGPDDIAPPPAEPVVDDPAEPVDCASAGAAMIIVVAIRIDFIIFLVPASELT